MSERRRFNGSERAASAARTLRKHMTPDDLQALARLLLGEDGE